MPYHFVRGCLTSTGMRRSKEGGQTREQEGKEGEGRERAGRRRVGGDRYFYTMNIYEL